MLKKLKWIVLAAVMLAAVAAVVVITNINGIVRKTVETAGTESLNLPTTLGGASVSLLSGDVSLSELAVGSPKGFDAPQMFTLGSISVDTSYDKLRGDPVRVNAIDIQNPRLVIEQKNLQTNIKAIYGQLDTTPPTVEGPPPTEPVEVTRVIIDELRISGAQVVLRPNLPGFKEEYALPIKTIELKNIGNADGAKNGEELGRVIQELVAQITNEAINSKDFPPELAAMKGVVAGDLKGLVDNIGGVVKAQMSQKLEAVKAQAQGQIDQLKTQAGEQVNQAKDKLKQESDKLKQNLGGLLGGEKKDK